MARIPLLLTGLAYDEETKHIVATFSDAPTIDDPDPANFAPSLSLEVELLPRVVDTQAVVQPEQPQLDQLTEVVDQLLLNDLMKDMMMEGLL